MTTLHELIEDLYQQTMADAVPAAPAPDVPAVDDGGSPDDPIVARIRRVLGEMGQLLTQDDELRLDVAPPTDEIRLRILNHWEQLTQSIARIREHEQSLEADIARMQPWGDFDVVKVEQLAARGVHIHFWRAPHPLMAAVDAPPLTEGHRLHIISHDSDWTYFVTIADTDCPPAVPAGVQPVEICPCPISTLIMLQTRDKDARRRKEMLREDYALAHYSEVYAALRQALPPGSPLPQLRAVHRGLRQRFRQLLAQI